MKNWKSNRGLLINEKNDNSIHKSESNTDKYNEKKNELYYFLNQDIKIKRIVNYEFKDIIYLNDKKIKNYFKWEKH